MDARFKFTTKLALSAAAALLLALPLCADTVLTVSPSTNVQIGNASCNDHVTLTLLSTHTASATTGQMIQVQVSVAYQETSHGPWLYATVPGQGTTTGSATVTGNVPAEGSLQGPAGLNVIVGLNLSSLGTFTTQATVNFHVISPSGTADVPVTVGYAANASCGGNTGSVSNNIETITPGSLTLTAAQGTSTTLTLLVQNATGSDITFTATPASATDTWLTTNATSQQTLPANGTAQVSVTATAGSMAAGTYSSSGISFVWSVGGALNVPVSFTVTPGGGGGNTGTLTLNGGTSNVASVTFNYIAAGSTATGIPAQQTVGIQDSNPLVTTYGSNFTTSAGGSWLQVNGSSFSPQSGQLIAANGSTVTLQPSNQITTLSSGSYTATVNLVATDNSTATINVILNVSGGSAPGVTVSPGLVYSFPAVAAGTTTTESQQFSVTAATGVILGGITPQGSQPVGGVFTLNTTTNTASQEVFNVTANPTGLGQGTYSEVIQITSSGSGSGTTFVLVTLTVGPTGSGCTSNCGGGNSVTSIVVPTSLAFYQQQGSNIYTGFGTSQAITITGAQGTSWSSAVTYNDSPGNLNPWLTFGQGLTSGVFGTSPSNMIVNFAPGNLPPSTTPYSATIAVTTPSGTTNVAVTLLITPGTTPVMLASPASTTFYYSGGTNPNAQTFLIGGTDLAFPPARGSTPAITAATTTATWLTPTFSGNQVTLNVNPAGLANGAYATVLNVTAGTYTNNPLPYPVVIVIGSGIPAGGGSLTLSSSSFTFNATAGGGVPGSQTLTVTAASSTSATLSISQGSCNPSSNVSWLNVQPQGSFTASATNSNFTITVNQSGLGAGTTCTGSISLLTSAGTQTVGVTMVVAAGGTSGNVTVTPTGPLNFSFALGGTNPQAQTLQIANSTSGSTQTPFTVQTSQTWITTNVSNASTPYTLSVSVNPAGLAASANPYTGTVTISPQGGTAVVVSVSLTVSSNPIVSATPLTLSFSYTAGGNNPSSQTVNVTAGGSTAGFTVQTSSSGWLHVSPTSGTTPNTGNFPLTVTADPTGLNAGQTYNGTITVSGTSPATGTSIIAVSFQVSAPLPTITKVTNAASGASSTFSPGELISLFGTSIGPATPVQLNSTNCPSPCTQVPTTMGGVQVVFLPIGVNSPLLYVSGTQINAVVPYEAANVPNLQVEVKFLGQPSNAFLTPIATTAAGFFTQNGSGTGPGSILVYDPQGNYLGVNSSAVPAGVGYVLSIFATGEGATSPPGVTGKVTNSTIVPLLSPTTCFMGSQPATVNFSGEAPGDVAGVWQINTVVPPGAGTGNVSISCGLAGGSASQTGVTVFLK